MKIHNVYPHPYTNRRLTYVFDYLERFCPNTEFGLLDIGCGRGEYFPFFKKWSLNSKIIGFDVSLEKLFTAKTNAKNNNIDIVRGDISHLPFKNGTFDILLCLSVLEHLNNPKMLVNDFKHVLKENGIVIIIVPWLWDIRSHPIKAIINRSLDSVRKSNPNLFSKIIFSNVDSLDDNKLMLRKWISFFIRGDSKRKSIERYAKSHIDGTLKDLWHKHFFTPNEWIELIEDCGLTVIDSTGSYICPPGVSYSPTLLKLFYAFEDNMPKLVKKWLGWAFIIVAVRNTVNESN